MAEKLYLNDVLVELSDNSVSLTSQINDIGDLKDKRASYSNNIKLPQTAKNASVMDMLGVVGSTSRTPYINVSVKYVVDGIELISAGKGVIKNTNDYYNLVIYSGNVSIIDLLGNAELKDLDWSSYNHDMTSDTYFSSFTNTAGYIYGLGRYYEGDSYNAITQNLQSPSFYIHTLMDMIFTQNGFTITGDLLTNSDYLSRVTSMDTGYIRANTGSPAQVFTDSTPKNLTLDNSYTVETIYTIIHTHTVASSGVHRVNVTGLVNSIKGWGGAILVTSDNQFNVKGQVNLIQDTEQTYSLEVDIDETAGTTIQVWIREITERNFDTNKQEIEWTSSLTTTITFLDLTQPINFEELIGSTKQVDFVKDIMQHFGVILRKTLNADNYELKLMESLLQDKSNAEDWTNKFVKFSGESYKSKYAQTNILKYRYDDNSEDDEIETYADGEFYIDDLNLAQEKTVFTSLFKASEMSVVPYWYTSYYVLNHWELKTVDEIETITPVSDGLRMFNIELITGSFQYRYELNITTPIVWVGTFPKLSFVNCDYSYEVANYYNGISSMLNDYKKLNVWCNLSVLDNYELDFFKLKYFEQLGQTFYLNKVSSFRKGKMTKVEIVQVNEYTPTVLPDAKFIVSMSSGSTLTATLTKIIELPFIATLTSGSTLYAVLSKSVQNKLSLHADINGCGSKVEVDSLSPYQPSVLQDLQSVTDVDNDTSNDIFSTAFGALVMARASVAQVDYAFIYYTGQVGAVNGTTSILLTPASKKMEVKVGTFTTDFIFPTWASAKTITWQDLSGTVALLSDIVTNLSTTRTATTVRIDSSNGTNATIGIPTSLLAGIVSNGVQSFWGVKTFIVFPITPSSAPTTNYQVANKKYVDDEVAGVGTPTLDDVVLADNTSSDTINIFHATLTKAFNVTVTGFGTGKLQNNEVRITAEGGNQYGYMTPHFINLVDVTSTYSMQLSDNYLRFTKGSFYHNLVFTAPTANRNVTFPNKAGTVAMIDDTTLQKVLDNVNTSTTDIVMNSGGDIILWSGVGSGSKITINTSLFNMADSAGTTFTQRTNAKWAATKVGGQNSLLAADGLQFQESTANGSSVLSILPPASMGSSRSATFIDATGEITVWRTGVPASKTATGKRGEVAGDANYFYFCYANDNWRRIAIDGTW